MHGLVVHQDARYVRNRELRFFDGACFLTRAISYQRVIGTRYEACAIKCPENKSAVEFPSVFNTQRKPPHFALFVIRPTRQVQRRNSARF